MGTVTSQPGKNTITLQRALQDGITAGSIRAVAEWNGRRSNGHIRYARQAAALHRVADELERANREDGEWTNVARAA